MGCRKQLSKGMGAPYNQPDARQASPIVAPGIILSRSERGARTGWRVWSVLVHWRCSGAREREPRRRGGTAEVKPAGFEIEGCQCG